MSIWITQTVVREIRAVAYYENSGEGLAHYANWLNEWAKEHEVSFARHGMPPDIEVRELGTGKSRKEVCERELGLKPIVVAPRLAIEDGREQVRRILAQVWFDEEAAKQGIACLTEYSKKWDETNKVYMQEHNHNWACHGADAMRTMATIHTGRAGGPKKRETRASGGSWQSL